MKDKTVLVSTVLCGFQMLFSIVVLGLSVTLTKDHYNRPYDSYVDISKASGAPTILPLRAGIGAVTIVAVILNCAIEWTDFLRRYINMVVDVIVILINVVGGIVSSTLKVWAMLVDTTSDHRVETWRKEL